MTGSPLVRVRILIEGRVQGVNFRHHTRLEAVRLGISGWVRNLPDGRVEAVLEGTRAAVEEMVAWTRHGPGWAHVTEVVVHEEMPTEERGFVIR